jgi:hypothetical protein
MHTTSIEPLIMNKPFGQFGIGYGPQPPNSESGAFGRAGTMVLHYSPCHANIGLDNTFNSHFLRNTKLLSACQSQVFIA